MLISVVGGGQLGRMLGLAGLPLGLRFRFLDPSPTAPARDVGELIVGAYDDAGACEQLATGADAVTFEFENVSAAALKSLSRLAPVWPPPKALEVAQDRIAEKDLFASLGVRVQAYRAVSTRADLDEAAGTIGYPFVLKTRRMGYDGKGQVIVRDAGSLGRAWTELGAASGGLIAEAFVAFSREVSIIAVRGRDGAFDAYPLVQNEHAAGILRRTVAPAPAVTATMEAKAREAARRVMEHTGHVGVLAIEFFVVDDKDGPTLVANEMAPRVHNSGHWSIEGARCSQFENHCRAVAGLPQGPCTLVGPSAMVNLIGTPVETARAAMGRAGVRVHWYGKEPRAGRKVGHLTLVGPDAHAESLELARALRLME